LTLVPKKPVKVIETRNEHELKLTATQEKITVNIEKSKDRLEQRRKMIYVLDMQGYPQKEIAELLGASLSTVEKDLHLMRYYCLRWSSDLIKTSRTTPLVDSFNQIDSVQKELWAMYRFEKDFSKKHKLLDSIVSNCVKRGNLLKERRWYSEHEEKELQRLENEFSEELQSN